MKNTTTNDIKPKQPLYMRGKFYLYLGLSIIPAIFIMLLISVVALRWVNPPTTSFVLQQDWESLPTERYSLRENWVDYDNLQTHSTLAVVASEDQLFWDHWGFDFESIQEAWEDRQEGVRSRGASSITQQVAKNLYLWPAESYVRKGIEAGITILIEVFWPKERIIEMHLNIAEFGPGIFGIGNASEQFFNLKASEMQPEMSAKLAAVLPSPKRMRVSPPSPFTQERSQWILHQMTHLSGIAYVQIDSTDQTDEVSGAEDSSANTDSLITSQSVQSASFTPDSIGFRKSVDDQIMTDSLQTDAIPDSIPSY